MLEFEKNIIEGGMSRDFRYIPPNSSSNSAIFLMAIIKVKNVILKHLLFLILKD